MADKPSAAERVFATHELAEAILFYQPPGKILTIQRVSSMSRDQIRALISTSSEFRAKLCMRDPSGSQPTTHTCGEEHSPCPEEASKSGCCTANRITGLPEFYKYEPDPQRKKYRIAFSNKSQARAVLLRDRTKLSWEDMYYFMPPALMVWVWVDYLVEQELDMDEEHAETWIRERSTGFTLSATPLGEIIKQAASLVITDDEAWDPAVPQPMPSPAIGYACATSCLKLFQHPVEHTADLDINSDVSQSFWELSQPPPTRLPHGSRIIVHTWPWTQEVANNAALAESTWLDLSDFVGDCDSNDTRPYIDHITKQLTTAYRIYDWSPDMLTPSDPMVDRYDRHEEVVSPHCCKMDWPCNHL